MSNLNNNTIKYPEFKNSSISSFANNREIEPARGDGSKHIGNKGKKNKKNKIVFIIALIIFILASCCLGYIIWTYINGQKQYDDLKDYADINNKTLADMVIDWESLKKINPDIAAWIYIPNTVISYPITWKEKDNDYYLTHNFNNKSTKYGAEYGCVFLSGSNKRDFSDNCNFIYGHNMFNGTVFSLFSDHQKDTDWFKQNQYAYLLTPSCNYKLRIFAVNKVDQYAQDIAYSSFGSLDKLHEYTNLRIQNSTVSLDFGNKKVEDLTQIFAFSTCSSPDTSNRIISFSYAEETAVPGSKGSVSSHVNTSDIENLDNDSRNRKE